jgi:hypothetical protein
MSISQPDVYDTGETRMQRYVRQQTAKMQKKFPDMPAPPDYAAQEWVKEDVDVFFETKGVLTPKRYHVPPTKKAAKVKARQLGERMLRKEREVAELRAELGLGASRTFTPEEVNRLQQHLEAASGTLMGPFAKLRPNVQAIITEATGHLARAGEALGPATGPPPLAGAEAAVKAATAPLQRRLERMERQMEEKEAELEQVADQLMQAEAHIEAREGRIDRLLDETRRTSGQLRVIDDSELSVATKCREAQASGKAEAWGELQAKAKALFSAEAKITNLQDKVAAQAKQLELGRGREQELARNLESAEARRAKMWESEKRAKDKLNAVEIKKRHLADDLGQLRDAIANGAGIASLGSPLSSPGRSRRSTSSASGQLSPLERQYESGRMSPAINDENPHFQIQGLGD